jgi:flagellar basal body-associated protein FliL
MFKIVRKIFCIGIIALILFIGITIWGGGDKFRWLGKKAGEIIQKGADTLGKQADELREKADATKENIKKWIGKDEDHK